MRDVVAPVLQELRRAAGVIHLVEVHLQRLVEAIHPHRQDQHDQGRNDPQVQLIEAATRFRVERRGSVGVWRSARQPPPQAHDLARNVPRPIGPVEVVAVLVPIPVLFVLLVPFVHSALFARLEDVRAHWGGDYVFGTQGEG